MASEEIPEDNYVPNTDLPQIWRDSVEDKDPSKTRQEYLDQIPHQLHEDLLKCPKWMKLMTSEKALKTFGDKFDGRSGGVKIEPLELTFREDEMPVSHRSKCRQVPLQLVDIVSERIQKFIDKGLFKRIK